MGRGHPTEVALEGLSFERRTIMAEGFLMYDPRLKKEVESGNPALILAHMVRNTGGVGLLTDVEEEQFWDGIARLADWLEETDDGKARRTKDEMNRAAALGLT